MKTFTITVFTILLICSATNLFSQNEIYNDNPKTMVVMDTIQSKKVLIMIDDSLFVDTILTNNVGNDYYTEEDYYNKKRETKNEEVIVYTEEELAEDPKRHNNEGVRVIAEVVVEVFFNVLLTFALFN